MSKKTLTVPPKGTELAAPSPLHAMTHSRVDMQNASPNKEENKRTSIVINPTTYRKFKAYAVESGQTVTSLINAFMEETLAKVGK